MGQRNKELEMHVQKESNLNRDAALYTCVHGEVCGDRESDTEIRRRINAGVTFGEKLKLRELREVIYQEGELRMEVRVKQSSKKKLTES